MDVKKINFSIVYKNFKWFGMSVRIDGNESVINGSDGLRM